MLVSEAPAMRASDVPVRDVPVAWSSDGGTVYYQVPEPDGGWSIRAVSVGGGASRMLLKVDDPSHPPSDVFATDGRRLYFTLSDFESDVWVMTLRTE